MKLKIRFLIAIYNAEYHKTMILYTKIGKVTKIFYFINLSNIKK